MARPSKAQHSFAIYEDGGTSTPDRNAHVEGEAEMLDKRATTHSASSAAVTNELHEEDTLEDEINSILEAHSLQMKRDEDDRRASGLTSTTYSTMPDSDYSTDTGDYLQERTYSTPIVVRPPFMRSESVRRLQMSSPPPFGSRSSRKSISRTKGSRTGTPRSVRSSISHGSPRYQRASINDQRNPNKAFPLVLLHVTLLAVDLPWSVDSMEEVLPSSTLENLRQLHSKIGEIVLQRGVLIPHPRHEYDLLEERLLEALELRSERITKCGHFRNRNSSSSVESMFSTSHDSDSAVGSSIEGSVEDVCEDCDCQVKLQRHGVDKRWSVEVFAANGLLRAPAWAEAWSEMEKVDVRITPWISDLDRRRLCVIKAEEDALREESTRQIALSQQREAHVDDEDARIGWHEQSAGIDSDSNHNNSMMTHSAIMEEVQPFATSTAKDLPRIYSRPSDIPMSLLLRNYFVLLAQDRRNLVILLLSTGLLFAMMQPLATNATSLGLSHLDDFTVLQCPGLTHDLTEPAVIQRSSEGDLGENVSSSDLLDDTISSFMNSNNHVQGFVNKQDGEPATADLSVRYKDDDLISTSTHAYDAIFTPLCLAGELPGHQEA